MLDEPKEQRRRRTQRHKQHWARDTEHRQTNQITQHRKLRKGSTKKQGVNQSACYGCSTVPLPIKHLPCWS
jgi:hypothetical protein